MPTGLEMLRYIKIFVAVFCIVCILALCIAPYADIPVTVLEALQVVIMLMFALITSLLLATGLFYQVLGGSAEPLYRRKPPIRSLLLPLDSSCVQQC
ncbi:MAG: hypothetical protein WBD10_03890 [Acidobacteriaceae bacterium]